MGIDMTYLAHTQQKNAKWGVRRYRNYDGTLTEEGKIRYAKYNKNKVEDAREFVGLDRNDSSYDNDIIIPELYKADSERRRANRDTYIESGSATNKALGELSKSMTGLAKSMHEDNTRKAKKRQSAYLDLSSISDEELRKRVNRLNMEKQYKEFTLGQYYSKSGRSAEDVAATVANVANISAAVIGLTVGVLQIKKMVGGG